MEAKLCTILNFTTQKHDCFVNAVRVTEVEPLLRLNPIRSYGPEKKLYTTVMVKSIHAAWCIKQNDQLLTLANNNLVGCDCHETTRDVIIPAYQNMSESITANKVF